MSDERLILKAQPRHHRQRFFIIVAMGAVGVVAVWGWQMHMTFQQFADAHAAAQAAASVADAPTVPTPTVSDQQAAELEANVERLKGLLQQAMSQQQTQTQVPTETQPAGEVAGATTEVPAN